MLGESITYSAFLQNHSILSLRDLNVSLPNRREKSEPFQGSLDLALSFKQGLTLLERGGGKSRYVYTQAMKNFNLKSILALASVSAALAGSSLYADQKVGTLNVTVVDENGAVVQEAPIYIYGEHKTHFVGGKEIPGTTTLTMVEGDYRISTALIKKTGDYVDRFASHEAHVQVLEGDNTAVILTLRPVADPLGEGINYAELHKIGISDEVARNFN